MDSLSSNVYMPAKKPSLFDVSGKEPPKPKAPTLKQFLKETKDATFPLYTRISIIWYPGNWDNYSIECELFRVSIGPNHPVFSVLDGTITKFCLEEKQGILIRVEDADGTIGFAECAVYGDWERIGNAGFRFRAADNVN